MTAWPHASGYNKQSRGAQSIAVANENVYCRTVAEPSRIAFSASHGGK